MEEMGLFVLFEKEVGFCLLSEIIRIHLLKRFGLIWLLKLSGWGREDVQYICTMLLRQIEQ